jgi:hypothetical protein
MALLVAVVSSLIFFGGWTLVLIVPPLAVLASRWFANARTAAVAVDVEETVSRLKGRLIPALQIAEADGSGREGYSKELASAALAAVDGDMGGQDLRRVVRRGHVWAGFGLLAAVGALVAAASLLFPARLRVGAANLVGRVDRVVRVTALSADTTVARDGVVALRCAVEPAGVFGAALLRIKGARNSTRRVALTADSCLIVVEVEDGFDYQFEVLGVKSESRAVRPAEPLVVRSLRFSYEFPRYAGLKRQESNSTDIRVLKGTVLGVSGEANRPVVSAALCFGPDTIELATGTRGDDFAGQVRLLSDVDGALRITDRRDASGEVPLRIRVIPDEVPLVRILVPGRDVDLPASMKLPVIVDALDDFGLGRVRLRYGRDSLTGTVALADGGGLREDTVAYIWDLSGSGLLPGDVMRYRVEAFDNDDVSGPKLGTSDVFAVRFPTMTEIYSASVQQAERTQEQLAPLQTNQEQVAAELERASEALDRSRDLTWDEKQALSAALSSQEGLLQQISDLQREVQDLADDLGQGLSFDSETMERLGELQQLLNEVIPPELKQSLSDLRQRLEGNAPEVRRTLEQLQREQERLRVGIDRALDLLRRIVDEQRLDALAKSAAELARNQESVTQHLEREDRDWASRLQPQLATGLDSLLQRIRDLAAELSDSTLVDSLTALSSGLESESLPEQSSALAAQLRSGRKGGEAARSRSVAAGLRDAANRLESMSNQLKRQRSADLAGNLAVLASDILALSQEQERLEGIDAGPAEAARRMAGLAEGTRIAAESLVTVTGRTMLVSPRLGQQLAEVMAVMTGAGKLLNDGMTAAARSQMPRARAGLNGVAKGLLEAMAQASASGGESGGMESLLDQLSKMAGEQMGLNSEMGGMPIPIPGGLSPSQMQTLQRVLSMQSSLRQRLEQMMQTMGGDQPGLMASLEQVLEEMKASERDLADLNVTRQLIDRQQSILSHLLDAQRSLRQRGFKEERESETAKAFEVRRPLGLPPDRGERDRILREELLRALKADYPRDYEAVIRAYFERLLY